MTSELRPIYEIRDYHYRPERMDEYRDWAAKAAPVLRDRMDVLGFWVDVGIPGQITGSDPMKLRLGSANVTWIIRWDDMNQREAGWEALWVDPDWTAIWEEHPGYQDYLHMSVRYLREA